MGSSSGPFLLFSEEVLEDEDYQLSQQRAPASTRNALFSVVTILVFPCLRDDQERGSRRTWRGSFSRAGASRTPPGPGLSYAHASELPCLGYTRDFQPPAVTCNVECPVDSRQRVERFLLKSTISFCRTNVTPSFSSHLTLAPSSSDFQVHT